MNFELELESLKGSPLNFLKYQLGFLYDMSGPLRRSLFFSSTFQPSVVMEGLPGSNRF